MANKNIIQRSHIILRILADGKYPSKREISTCLENAGYIVTKRTIERDLRHIESTYDLDVIYYPDKGGYGIENALELSKTLHFIWLAESADIVLNSLDSKRTAMKYISVSPLQTPRGTDLIKPILEALNDNNPRGVQRVVKFDHIRYETGEVVSYEVQPYLLKEFEGRWYLFAYVDALGAFRTFGLDRIDNLIVTATEFKRDPKRAATAEKFEDIYGLIYEPDQRKDAPIETVKLRGSDFVVKHLAALPLHESQEIDGSMVTLQVIINPELTNKIMSFGEHIEVLEPLTLRKRIKQRLTEALKKY